MSSSSSKKIVVIAVLGIVLGIVIGSVGFAAPRAEAGLLDTFRNFFRPLFGKPTSTVNLAPPNSAPAPATVPSYQPALDYERAVIEAVKKASPTVVSITVSKNVPILERCPVNPFPDLPPGVRRFFEDDFLPFEGQCERGTRLEEVGGGSGFIISADGMILTNKHVVLDKEASYTVFTNDGKKYSARVLARDPVQDLAVVKIDVGGLKTMELGDSDAVELGQTAIAIGNALGEFRNTVSVGTVSGLSRTVTAGDGSGFAERIQGVIQTDAAINPGNSGGPLLNLRGEVIGINTAIVSGAQNIGFAIPINRAKRDIESVKTSGEIQAPYLGVRYLTVTPDIAKSQKLGVGHGALVRGTNEGPAVMPGSPAAQAGVQAEDVITAVNGKRVDEDHQLADLISQYRVGEAVRLTVNRAGQELELSVTLTKRPE